MMRRINLNDLAAVVTRLEGRRISLPIGQVKEVIRLTLEQLGAQCAAGNTSGVLDALKRVHRNVRRRQKGRRARG